MNAEEQVLWDRYRETGNTQELQLFYMASVRMNAKKMQLKLENRVELGDLIASGVKGLVDAIKAFNPDYGVQFTTFCVLRIRGAMLDELREQDWFPRLIRQKSRKVSAARESLEQELGHRATDDELMSRLGWGSRMGEALHVPDSVSISQLTYEGEGREFDLATLLEEKREPAPVMTESRKDFLREVCAGLSKSERLLVILYYYENMTMKAIGETLNLSESRISQMHTDVVVRLRKRLKAARFDLQVS